jgi:protein SCO1/2
MPHPNRHDRKNRRIALLAILSVLTIGLAVVLALGGCSGGSSSPGTSAASHPGAAGGAPTTDSTGSSPTTTGFDGAALPAGSGAHDFTLADATDGGHALSLARYRGQIVVLTFLYSNCGPTCVVIAQQIRGAIDELGAHPVPVLVVSADPATDTPARVRSFLAQVSLTGRARWLTGPLTRLRAVWRAYRVVPASAGRAAFDNSASVFLLDRSGRERVLFQSEQLTPEGLAHDADTLARR